MNNKQSLYLLGWLVMIAFYAATIITGELWYLLGSSLCVSVFGIGGRPSKGSGISSLPRRWQAAMAIYLLGLAIYFWLNLDFVREANALTLFLFLLPFLPLIVSSEYKRGRARK